MEYIKGHAVFTPDGNVKVGEEILSASHILIATGGYPILPSIPGENFSQNNSGLWHIVYIHFVQHLNSDLLVV